MDRSQRFLGFLKLIVPLQKKPLFVLNISTFPPFFPDIVDIAVHRNELFCLHGNGRLSHFSLLSAERCVERLLRRESWPLAATVCCMFQHTVTASRVRRRRRSATLRAKERPVSSSCSSLLFDPGQEARPHRPPGAPQVAARLQRGPGAVRSTRGGPR